MTRPSEVMDMKKRVGMIAVGVVGLLIGLLALTACDIEEVIETASNAQVRATDIQTAAFAVAGVPTLDMDTSNGSVQYTGIDGATEIAVSASLTSRGETLEEANERVGRIILHMEQDGDLIRLQYLPSEQEEDVRRYSSVSFDVTGPPLADVMAADTSNGSIIVQNVEGMLDLNTSNGMIRVVDFRGELYADTSNGMIDVDRAEGILRLDTSNGMIEVSDVVATVDAETSNGRIEFSGELVGDTHRFATSNGPILLRVSPAASLSIEARTSNASISSNLPLVGSTRGASWDAELNPPAAAHVELRTSNGNIRIEGR